jgi:hypothetical protein
MNGLPESALSGSADRAPVEQYDGALHYEAPFLIEKLLKERIVDTPEEGEALFTEVKRFLVLSRLDPGVAWNVYSARVDEAWHQFVLFTREYVEFCHRYFGRYLHHNPSNAPESLRTEGVEPSTFRSFRFRYLALFGVPLPDPWFDEKSVTLARRVIYDGARSPLVSIEGGMVTLASADGTVLFSVSEIARDALDFMRRTGTFYVRELPGDLTEEEKVGLVATLVEHRLLRVAP